MNIEIESCGKLPCMVEETGDCYLSVNLDDQRMGGPDVWLRSAYEAQMTQTCEQAKYCRKILTLSRAIRRFQKGVKVEQEATVG